MHRKTIFPKSPIGQAIGYVLNHWRALMNYCRDGVLKIDNNTAERAIKPLVLGRKNYLFAGSHEGAKNAAILYSIIETCKLNGINPFAYLKDVLTRLPTTLMKNLNQLLPYNWKPLI
jgi:transposase